MAQNFGNITETSPSPEFTLPDEGKPLGADPMMGQADASQDNTGPNMMPVMDTDPNAVPAPTNATSQAVQAGLNGWNKFALANNQQKRVAAMKKVLDMKEEGAKQFIEQVTKDDPEAAKMIPPTWPYTDEKGQVNWYEWHKRAWYGVQLYKAQQNSKALSEAKEKATAALEAGRMARASMTNDEKIREADMGYKAKIAALNVSKIRAQVAAAEHDDAKRALAFKAAQTDYQNVVDWYGELVKDSNPMTGTGTDHTEEINELTKEGGPLEQAKQSLKDAKALVDKVAKVEHTGGQTDGGAPGGKTFQKTGKVRAY